MRHQQRIHRKKAEGGARGDSDGKQGEEAAHVSQPGEAAEQEADAVSDHVADELHGGGKDEHGHAGKEQAPPIGAKLKDGAVSLSKKKEANANQLPLPGVGSKDDKKGKDPAKAQRDPKDPAFLAAKAKAAPIAAQLQAALADNQKGRVTMAAGVSESGAVVLGSSEGSYFRPTVAKVAKTIGGEIAKGSAGIHAEINIIGHVGKGLVAVAAGRPICQECEDAILRAKALPASTCLSGKVY